MRHALLFVGAGTSLAQTTALARAAEDAGMDSLYAVEAYRSAFVPLAAIASVTRRVRIGPYVSNAYGRSPLLTALAALDLDELSGGRVVLAVGTGNRHVNEDWQGIAHADAYAKMEDYVSLLRRMVSARAGEAVAYEGRVHGAHWTAVNAPVRPSIPVHLAAIYPKMLKVAARVADGIALGVMLSVEQVRDVVRPAVMREAESAGRDPSTIGFQMGSVTAVSTDRDAARLAARRAIAGFYAPYLPHPYYDFLLREQGFAAVAESLRRLVPRGEVERAGDAIPDEVVDRLTVSGTPEEARRRLAAYEGLVDEVIHLDVSPTEDRVASTREIASLCR